MVDRPAKKRGPRCLKPSCCKRGKKCNLFSDDDCETIFTEFWGCGDAGMQNTFIKSLVDNKEKACTTISPSKTSRRKNTKAFRLKNNGITYDVCKEMFLNTLGISKARVDSVMESSSVGISATVRIRVEVLLITEKISSDILSFVFRRKICFSHVEIM